MKSDDEILKEAAERSELLDVAGFDYLSFVKQTNEAYNRLFCKPFPLTHFDLNKPIIGE